MTSSSPNRNREKILTVLLVAAALSPLFAQTRTTTRSTNPGRTVTSSSKTGTSVKNNNTKDQTDNRKATASQTDRKDENTKQEQTGFDPDMYQVSTRRTKLIQNAVISHAKTGDLNDSDTTKAILNEIKRQMPVTPAVPLKKTDSVAISLQARKNTQKGQSSSGQKTIQEIAEQKYPLYKIGDTVSFDYFMGSRRYSVKGKLIRITQKSITVDDKMINLIDLDPVEQSKFDPKINQQVRAKYIRTQSLIENRINTTEEQNNAGRLIVQYFKDNENAGYIFNPEKDSWETAEEVATEYMSAIKSLQKNGMREGLAAYEKKNDKRAVGIFSILAKLDHPDALFMMGKCYFEGRGIKKDYKDAVTYYRKAADQNHAKAAYYLGKCYQEGRGVDEDKTTADKWFRKSLETFQKDIDILDPEALYLLATFYDSYSRKIKVVDEDVELYKKLILESAENGYVPAECSIGCDYLHGFNFKKDTAKGIDWLRKAGEHGSLEAQVELGIMYGDDLLYKTVVKHDYYEAAKWLEMAAKQGDASSQYYLGQQYFDGKGVRQDYAEAARLFRQAAEQDFMLAECALGACYYDGLGVGRNYAEAAKWFAKAAEFGYPLAQYFLGLCYYSGEGVKRDYTEAVKWFTKAANGNIPEAQNELGRSFYDARGVRRDYSEAVKWFTKAAEQGNAQAQYNLCLCYLNGNGVELDIEEAVFWLRKSAAQGNGKALNLLQALLR